MYHKQLVEHIINKKASGVTDKDILHELTEDGWSKEDISASFEYAKSPEKIFALSNQEAGVIQDRCLLYTFRCAVYYAEGGRDKKKLLWWNWKDTQG